MEDKFVFAEITFTGEKVWGWVKGIRPTIGLSKYDIYTQAFFPIEKLRYESYLYFNIIAVIKPKPKVYEHEIYY